jgi:cyclopropane fatty-acyl-phospholipid synthase-like methyltransferase
MNLSHQQYRADYESPQFVEIFKGFKHFLWSAEKEAGDFLVEKLHEQWPLPDNKDHLHILEIGCGDGALTKHVLHQMKEEYRIGTYTGIDVSEPLLAAAKEELHTLSAESHQLINQDANQFTSNQKYDLILSLNSWYGLEQEKINYYQSLLSPTGILVILLNSQKNLIWQLRHMYDAQLLASEDVELYIRKNKVLYKQWQWDSKQWNRNQCWDNQGIKAEAIPFFQYVTRQAQLDKTLQSIVAKLAPSAFILTQQLFFIYNRQPN